MTTADLTRRVERMEDWRSAADRELERARAAIDRLSTAVERMTAAMERVEEQLAAAGAELAATRGRRRRRRRLAAALTGWLATGAAIYEAWRRA